MDEKNQPRPAPDDPLPATEAAKAAENTSGPGAPSDAQGTAQRRGEERPGLLAICRRYLRARDLGAIVAVYLVVGGLLTGGLAVCLPPSAGNTGLEGASFVGGAFAIIAGLVSALALVLVVVSIDHQRRDIDLQREDLDAQRQALELQAEELRRTADAQQKQVEYIAQQTEFLSQQAEAMKAQGELAKLNLEEARRRPFETVIERYRRTLERHAQEALDRADTALCATSSYYAILGEIEDLEAPEYAHRGHPRDLASPELLVELKKRASEAYAKLLSALAPLEGSCELSNHRPRRVEANNRGMVMNEEKGLKKAITSSAIGWWQSREGKLTKATREEIKTLAEEKQEPADSWLSDFSAQKNAAGVGLRTVLNRLA